MAGRTYRMITATHGPVHFVEVDGVAHRVSRDEGGVLRSPAPALVVATPVAVGAEVAAGAPVLVLESMKMETRINAPFAATVRELHVATGSQVETGAPLMRLEPKGDAVETGRRRRRRSRAARAAARPTRSDALGDLKAVLLGYDVTPVTTVRPSAVPGRSGRRRRAGRRRTRRRDRAAEHLRRLRRTQPQPSGRRGGAHRPARALPREYFHSYLQTLDVERGGLPELFRAKLRSVFAHYGVTDLDRTPQLEGAVFRIFLAQQRSAPDLTIVTAILQRWHVEPAARRRPRGARP